MSLLFDANITTRCCQTADSEFFLVKRVYTCCHIGQMFWKPW